MSIRVDLHTVEGIQKYASGMNKSASDKAKILPYIKPGNILEIGCGTGLLLFAIAPHVEKYHASDFSHSAVSRLRQSCSKLNLHQVELCHGLADDLTSFADHYYDLVILNSVVQYFPDKQYFEQVLTQALAKLQPGGLLFLGDVRNKNILQEFHLDVEQHTITVRC